MSTLAFIDRINRKRLAGQTAFLLQFNTNDRYFDAEKNESPLPLRLAISAKFPNHDVGYYSQSTGMMSIMRPGDNNKSIFTINSNETPVDAVTRGIRALRENEKSILIIDFTQFLIPNGTSDMLHPDTTRMIENMVRVSVDDELRKKDSFVIGISYTREIHELVKQNWCIIDLPLPDSADRMAYYKLLLGKNGFATLEDDISEFEYSSLSKGARLRDIESVMRQAHGEARKVTREDLNAVRETTLKALVGDLLVVRKPSSLTFDDIAGMESIKGFVKAIAASIKAGKYGLAPAGILIVGPPGTGKTYVVDAIAQEFGGYQILEWRNMKSMWLGKSEANIDSALQAITANSPVLVAIDEADQILTGRQENSSTDGGTSGYMFGRLLSFMGDGQFKGKIVWVLTSNRPDLIDPALADRIGACVPLLRPGRTSIPEIMRSLAKQIDIPIEIDDNELIKLANSLPQQVSVRKLKDLLGMSALHASDDNVRVDDLRSALSDVLFNEDQLKIDYWTALACRMATYASLLPWRKGQNVIVDNIPDCLKGIVDSKTGDINSSELDRKIRELSRTVGI